MLRWKFSSFSAFCQMPEGSVPKTDWFLERLMIPLSSTEAGFCTIMLHHGHSVHFQTFHMVLGELIKVFAEFSQAWMFFFCVKVLHLGVLPNSHTEREYGR